MKYWTLSRVLRAGSVLYKPIVMHPFHIASRVEMLEGRRREEEKSLAPAYEGIQVVVEVVVL